ncbi:hypothetical protein JXB37_08585, partial [candidate division WOR-3 bacterium]|nr:hypothetical protein [candidate division WOR-3 bacterium]
MTRHLLVVLLLATAAPALEGGRYLIICDDDFSPALAPLAEWKTRKGAAARVVPLSEAGATPAAVQDYIRDAWANWPVRPEFVLLACSPARLPGDGFEDDCFYGDIAGDYRMEIPVGRFPAATARECSTMVNRTLRYELAPDSADTLWLTRATTVVCEETPPDSYYQADSRLARSYWQQHGYTLTESLANFRGHTAYHVTAALNQGRSVITYRGLAGGFWTDPFWQFHPYGYPWINGSRTPVFVSATCATVTVAPGEEMLGNLALRRGAPDSLHGALAFFGTTRLSNNCSRQRSTCYRGFFDAVYRDSVLNLGAATVRARNRVDSLFHEEFWYTEWCLLGDPELNLWTARPRDIEVEHDTLIL